MTGRVSITPSIQKVNTNFTLFNKIFCRFPPGFFPLHNAPFPRIVFITKKAGSVAVLKDNIEERAVMLAQYIIDNKTTVRAAAKKYGVSKSTVHKDISERLKYISRPLYLHVKEVLELNKAERHLRGGEATRRKYKGM